MSETAELVKIRDMMFQGASESAIWLYQIGIIAGTIRKPTLDEFQETVYIQAIDLARALAINFRIANILGFTEQTVVNIRRGERKGLEKIIREGYDRLP